MTESLSDILLRTAKAGETPYRKKFAIQRLERVRSELSDALDGAEETQGFDGWLSELIRDVEYAIAQIKGIQE